MDKFLTNNSQVLRPNFKKKEKLHLKWICSSSIVRFT
jgi:hypothetical protein